MLFQRRVWADAVHDARLATVQLALVEQPGNVAVAFVDVAHPVEDINREAGVPQPGKPVVPVPAAAQHLRQAGGRSGDDRPGPTVRHQVQHEDGSDNRVPPQAVIDDLGHPPAPVAKRVAELFVGAVRRQCLRSVASVCQHEGRCLALGQLEPRSSAVLGDFEGHVGEKTHRLVAAACLHTLAQPAKDGGSASVVHPGLERTLHVHFAGLTTDHSVDLVRCGVRVHGHEV